jgi:acetyl/propionyl-CoA carboxylase alpha subunit
VYFPKRYSYLDAQEIVRAARDSGADAIHPGYGFPSENAALSACEQGGLTFIGPRPDTMCAMGDKLESKRLMRQAGIPVLPVWDANPPALMPGKLLRLTVGAGEIVTAKQTVAITESMKIESNYSAQP